jgi:ankyrin repeat protein
LEEDRVLRLITYLVEEKGADVSLKSANGQTAAEMAKERNRLQVYRYLIQKTIEHKQAVDASREADKELLSRLLVKAREGNLSGMQSIIQEVQEACPTIWRGSKGGSILHDVACHAAVLGHGDIVNFLVSAHGVPIHRPPVFREVVLDDEEDENFCTPLTSAITFDKEDLALELLELLEPAGQTLDWPWRMGNDHTVLHLAAYKGMVGAVQALLRCGMDTQEAIEARNADGVTALELSLIKRHLPVVRVLIENYERKGQLQRALLREWQWEKRGPNYSSNSLLSWVIAVESWHIDEAFRLATVQYLVKEKNADLCGRSCERRERGWKLPFVMMPLHEAVAHGLPTIVQWFLDECHVPVNIVGGPSNLTPLHCTVAVLSQKEEDQLTWLPCWLRKGRMSARDHTMEPHQQTRRKKMEGIVSLHIWQGLKKSWPTQQLPHC